MKILKINLYKLKYNLLKQKNKTQKVANFLATFLCSLTDDIEHIIGAIFCDLEFQLAPCIVNISTVMLMDSKTSNIRVAMDGSDGCELKLL